MHTNYVAMEITHKGEYNDYTICAAEIDDFEKFMDQLKWIVKNNKHRGYINSYKNIFMIRVSKCIGDKPPVKYTYKMDLN